MYVVNLALIPANSATKICYNIVAFHYARLTIMLSK